GNLGLMPCERRPSYGAASISCWYSGESYHLTADSPSGNRMIAPEESMGSPCRISQLLLAITSPPCSLAVRAALGPYFSRTTSGSLTVTSIMTYALMRIALSCQL